MYGKKPIAIIGRIDPEEELLDGQTVKTRTIWKLMVERYGRDGVICVDTKNYSSNPLSIVRALAFALAKCDVFVVLLSRGGRKVFFPVLSLVARLSGKCIYHCLIGGKLADDIREGGGSRLVRQLNSFKINWVESRKLVTELKGFGVENASYLPNFKDVIPLAYSGLNAPPRSPYLFCTFSRVCAEKGIPEAVVATKLLNESGIRCELHVYGPIADGFKDELNSLLSENAHASYRGVEKAERSVEILKGYSALLFPTKWPGEGFPGTIIDAYAAGIPTIAYRWRYFDEIIEDGVTGIGCDPDVSSLACALACFTSMSSSEQLAIRKRCLERADLYSATAVFQTMAQAIEECDSSYFGG